MLRGSSGCPEVIPPKKSGIFWVFFCFFPLFFFQKTPPPAFVSKEVFIKWYIYMPNICGTGPAVRGYPQQTPAASMENISHGCSASQEYFDAAEWRQVPGGSQGDVIPTVAAPRSLPDQTETLVCHPDSCQSPIPANYRYWECQ